MPQFSSDFDVIPPQKRSSIFHKLICQCHFHTPPEVQGPLEAHGPPDGPPKLYGHRGHCLTSLPLSRWPCLKDTSAEAQEEPFFRIAFFKVVALLVALPWASVLVAFRPDGT